MNIIIKNRILNFISNAKWAIQLVFTFFISTLCILSSCEKDITVNLPKPASALVIEGSIENGEYPWVKITRNTPYFELLDSAALINIFFIDNAKVTVSDGVNIQELNFGFDFVDFIEIGTNRVPQLKYIGNTFKGEIGKTYYLNVQIDGKTYTSQTIIPQPVQLDSLRFKLQDQSNNDSLGYLWIYFKDPDSLGNYYRIFTKTFGKDSVFVHPFGSVADDKMINGKKVEYAVYRGRNPNVQYNPNDENNPHVAPRWAFVKGERAVMKFCTIDAIHFSFWRSVEQQMANDGNPFASPTSVVTNIEGGALGIWGGYGVFLDTITIPYD